jgi:hypothetical protein
LDQVFFFPRGLEELRHFAFRRRFFVAWATVFCVCQGPQLRQLLRLGAVIGEPLLFHQRSDFWLAMRS